MSMSEGLELQHGPESKLLTYVIPRANNLCKYLAEEGLAKLEAGHQVEEKVTIAIGKLNIQVTMNVRKVDG